MDEIYKKSVSFMTRNAVTFTLSPPMKDWTDDIYRTMWADIIINAFDSCREFIIIPELSSENRLHFHGVLKFSCKGHRDTYFDKRFRAQRVLQKYGSVEHCNWPKKQWIDYMWKDWIKTKETLRGIGIIINNRNIDCPIDWNIRNWKEINQSNMYHLMNKMIDLDDDTLNVKYNIGEIDWDLHLMNNIRNREIDWEELVKDVIRND